jgi:hypothetical protein
MGDGAQTCRGGDVQGKTAGEATAFLNTRQIQQKLEENAMLLDAINERQNVNSLKECAQYQAKLEANLRELASLLEKN